MRTSTLLLVLVGCSTGGGSPYDGPLDTGLDDVPDEVQLLEEAVLELVNQHRAAGASCSGSPNAPAGPLEMDPVLRAVARAHSEDMAVRDFFDHVNPDGDDPFDRLEAVEFGGGLPWAENVAAGRDTAEAVVADWMGSPGHCANIMEPAFGVIGIGYYEHDEGMLRHFWTQMFVGSH